MRILLCQRRRSNRANAGQDEVDAREKLLAIMMPGNLHRHITQEREG